MHLQGLARAANRTVPELRTHDRFGNRIDMVDFAAAWHELMGLIRNDGVHALGWTEDRPGAHVARAGLSYLWAQGEPGVGCPAVMTFAAIAALVIRDRNGAGMHVESTMVESALNVAAEMLVEYSRNGIEMRRAGNRGPGASPQGVYRCAGEDQWVAIAALDDGARVALADLIGRPELGPHDAGWRECADEIDKLISDWTARRSLTEAVGALRGCGVAAAPLVTSASLLTDPQLLHRGFWETVDHPVAGSFLCTGMPFSFAGKPRRWIRRVPPVYGQHTDEVLTNVLGRTERDLSALRESGTTSARPAGL